MRGRIERVYIRIPNWVGDVVMAEPFLAQMRRGFPKASIEVHGREALFPFLRAGNYYDHEIALRKTKKPWWPFKEGRRIAKERPPFDLAILMPNSFSSALVAWSMGARHRVGYRLNGRFPFLTKALGVRKIGRLRPIPMVDYYLKLAAAVGLDNSEVLHRPVLPISEQALEQAKAFFAECQLDPAKDEIWALNPGGAWATKRWPPQYVAKLADSIVDRGARPLILGGPDEKDIGRNIVSAMKHGKEARGLPDHIIRLEGLSAVLQQCRILITTDSGPRHFGVASGVPVVALIGPTHPAYTGVDYDRMALVCEEVECWPCHRSRCPNEGSRNHECMHRIDPKKVLETALELLASIKSS